MYKKYYTLEELKTMKFREFPNVIYNSILRDIKKLFCGYLTKKMIDVLDKAPITELDQYVNVYKYIQIIA